MLRLTRALCRVKCCEIRAPACFCKAAQHENPVFVWRTHRKSFRLYCQSALRIHECFVFASTSLDIRGCCHRNHHRSSQMLFSTSHRFLHASDRTVLGPKICILGSGSYTLDWIEILFLFGEEQMLVSRSYVLVVWTRVVWYLSASNVCSRSLYSPSERWRTGGVGAGPRCGADAADWCCLPTCGVGVSADAPLSHSVTRAWCAEAYCTANFWLADLGIRIGLEGPRWTLRLPALLIRPQVIRP